MRPYWNVRPRYSAGSPAMVDERTALSVARDEQEEYKAALDGIYGAKEASRARELGLSGIVERIDKEE